MEIWQAVLLAIIEGLTEFLPVSSTGHMIIASGAMHIHELPFTKILEVNIQFGAILAVVVLYYKRFFQSLEFYFKLFVAFLPAAVLGLLFSKHIDQLLESPLTVAVMLLLGGIIFLFIEKWFPNASTDEEKPISYGTAFLIGCFQCIALIPGVSRSASSIIGGFSQGLGRRQAAEFSFFLAVPTMFAASAYKLLKDYKHIASADVQVLAIGNVVAFVVAMLAIKLFVQLLTKYGFRIFGYYRIVLGIVLLWLMWQFPNLLK
jgi:undecaprenyl-diphosphatase